MRSQLLSSLIAVLFLTACGATPGGYSAKGGSTGAVATDGTSPDGPDVSGSSSTTAGPGDKGGGVKVYAWGPGAIPPLSDSEGVGEGFFDKVSTTTVKLDFVPPPPTRGYRLIQGLQEPSIQTPSEPLPKTLFCGTCVNLRHDFLVQADVEGTWWDIIQGPIVRVFIQKPEKTFSESSYVDFKVGYRGLKEFNHGSNVLMILSFPLDEGDTVSLYLHSDPKKDGTFGTPEAPSFDNKSPSSFTSKDQAERFFNDAQTYPLGSFSIKKGDEPDEELVIGKPEPILIRREAPRPFVPDFLKHP